MKIPLNAIPFLYQISKRFYKKEVTLADAIKTICDNYQINKNSATDYLYNFQHLMKGEKFTRTLNAESMEYYLKKILEDYGQSQLTIALNSLYLHINYYEKKQKTTMRKMRNIHKLYLSKNILPVLIQNYEQLVRNIESIENSLVSNNEEIRVESARLIKSGKCFIAYQFGKEIGFAPSRFIGYENNRVFKLNPKEIDGRETNVVINKILNSKPILSNVIEKEYVNYCSKLGIQPELKARKYWKIKLADGFNLDEGSIIEFPEGKIVERLHKSRERNINVINIAKLNFIAKYGKLFCQVCKFDFNKKYGDIGDGFIEGHHTIAISEMTPDYKTNPDEIAMLCSNCHRMVHRKRPWLTMDKLLKLIVK